MQPLDLVFFFIADLLCTSICVCAWLLLTLKMKRRTKVTHQFQRIPSSNRLNHLCKVRNYLEYHRPSNSKIAINIFIPAKFFLFAVVACSSYCYHCETFFSRLHFKLICKQFIIFDSIRSIFLNKKSFKCLS